MDGILPLWKPKGLTSHDCVIKIRKMFQTKKVGHTGTLDPDVEGVLPICIGKATKIVPFLTDTKKTYSAKLKLGVATDTEDASGNPIEEKSVEVMPEQQHIEDVMRQFIGEINQIPPMYSAVKVKGKRLYEYARENQYVERPVRRVRIDEIQLLSTPNEQEHSIAFRVVCSKGTYIRTLCVDIGKALGYPAHMLTLVREATGAFSNKNAVTFATIEEAIFKKQEATLLYPIQMGLTHLDVWNVDSETAKKVLYGQKLPNNIQLRTDPFVIMHQNRVLAIYQSHEKQAGYIKPVRVFSR
ncbi:tRNA pseudouridine(55) synthase TruB [Virgibacillus pantothenticus]|uniref:tRNA pseudouridine synthase B n=1 Tax=Virgibacillus pantothenticus TaxID=1473 RepID=A0A0L0QPQ3_VIRPA|nr:tRNA pseudouridine(55) synthase TruB [Virgibacillus pantothenticus]KNE20213.1 tRNA pseudouridine synthase B [Virgibacillus pantothenticus]MED3735761.1 tRNA pseudouridine(55) synthase TruB [Virgibacillus pantothenticus]QTY18039.1 tRNA pseudouridine(55) synthase TruB [Virgibacillus pantothenticus]SIS56332.1 tRNA pseudouridine55 synthase [Virgibacillus pantothenticus]GIP62044.1 tRNA pseudouridine synthase B [Virgibacillus pantothenticus]